MIQHIEKATSFITLITAFIILTSITYDLGFFFPLTGNFFLLMSLSDHVISAITFFPKLFIAVILSLVLSTITTGAFTSNVPVELSTKKNLLFDADYSAPYNIIMLMLAPIFFVSWMLFSPWWNIELLMASLVIALPRLIKLFLRKVCNITSIKKAAYNTLNLFFLILLMSFFGGSLESGYARIAAQSAVIVKRDYDFTKKEEAESKIIKDVKILRFFSDGLLIQSDSGVSFLINDDISHIKYFYHGYRDMPLICWLQRC